MSEPIYKIYISNYLKADGSEIITSERLLYSIPITDSANALIDPVVKCEMGKAGSFEFSVTPIHPFYNRFQQMKTIMRVEYSGENIFRGRVLTIDTNKMNGTRKVHLEGDFVFFNDSYQEGDDDNDNTEISIYEYLQVIIKEHNDQMDVSGSEYKKFKLGIVPGCPNYESLTTSAQRIEVEDSDFSESGYKKTQEVLNSLSKQYGGYFRTRYENGNCYLDWLEAYFTPNECGQPIKVTKNLIDLNATSEVENIFTYLIPIGNSNSKRVYIEGYKEDIHGANRSVSVPAVASWLRSQGRGSELNVGFHKASDYDDAIDNYGVIYIVQEFNDADTKAKLWNAAVNWVRDNYHGGITSFSATALDLHHLNPDSEQKWIVGTQIPIIFPDMSRHTVGNTPTETTTITLLTAQYTLHNPDKNSYILGIPSTLLSKSHQKRTNTKKTKKDAAADNDNNYRVSNHKEEARDYYEAAKAFIISKKYNIKEYQELWKESPAKAKAALKVSTVMVKQVLEDKDSNEYVITTPASYRNKSSKDVGSIYELVGTGTQWKITGIGRNLRLKPLESDSTLPVVGTLRWVSGGTNHDDIPLRQGNHTKKVAATVSAINTVKIDGNAGKIECGAPLLENWFTEEDAEKINAINKSLVMSAAEGSISINDVISQIDPLHMPSPKERLLLKVDPNKKAGQMRIYDEKKTDDDNAPPSFSILGEIGKAVAKVLGIGKDGSGDTDTIIAKGTEALQQFLDPNKAGSTDAKDIMAQISGGGGGNAAFSKEDDPDHPGQKKWRITLNHPITYEGDDGETHTVPSGTVGADDFYLDEVPSFKTNLAVINTAIIGVAHISDLNAINAFIQNLTSDTAIIQQISAKSITGTTITSSQFNGPLTGGPIRYSYYSQGSMNTTGLFYNATASADSGQITLKFYKSDGNTLDVNFNIADTQFYKDAVSAAWENAGKTAHFMLSSTNKLNPGGSVYVYAYYQKKDGTYARSDFTGNARYNAYVIEANTDANLKAENIKNNVTIFGVTGTYSEGVVTTIPSVEQTLNPGGSQTVYALLDGVTKTSVNIKARNLNLRTPQAAVIPGTAANTVTPGDGYDGLAKVTVAGDSNLTASNIKDGVKIFNVTGSYSAPGTVTILPSADQTLNPGGSQTVYAVLDGVNKASVKISAKTVSHTITNFDTTAPNGQKYSSWTNNSSGYWISGSGRGATVRIIVKGTWKCDGNSKEGTNYLESAPMNVYKKGWDNGASNISMPATISGSTTKNSVSVTVPTSSGTTTWTLKLSKDSGGAYLTINGNLKLRVT